MAGMTLWDWKEAGEPEGALPGRGEIPGAYLYNPSLSVHCRGARFCLASPGGLTELAYTGRGS